MYHHRHVVSTATALVYLWQGCTLYPEVFYVEFIFWSTYVVIGGSLEPLVKVTSSQ